MSRTLEEILQWATEETFASMAFMFPIEGAEAGAPPGDRTIVRVVFRGPFSGTLELAVQPEMLPALAGNMLGLDPGQTPTDAQQIDAVKELANIVCGNILPEVGTPRDVFNVCEQRLVTNAQPGEADDAAPAARVSVCMDAGTVDLSLFLDADALAQRASRQSQSITECR